MPRYRSLTPEELDNSISWENLIIKAVQPDGQSTIILNLNSLTDESLQGPHAWPQGQIYPPKKGYFGSIWIGKEKRIKLVVGT